MTISLIYYDMETLLFSRQLQGNYTVEICNMLCGYIRFGSCSFCDRYKLYLGRSKKNIKLVKTTRESHRAGQQKMSTFVH